MSNANEMWNSPPPTHEEVIAIVNRLMKMDPGLFERWRQLEANPGENGIAPVMRDLQRFIQENYPWERNVARTVVIGLMRGVMNRDIIGKQ